MSKIDTRIGFVNCKPTKHYKSASCCRGFARALPRTPLESLQRFSKPLAGEEGWGSGTSFRPSRSLPGPAASQVVVLGGGRRQQKAVHYVAGCGGFYWKVGCRTPSAARWSLVGSAGETATLYMAKEGVNSLDIWRSDEPAPRRWYAVTYVSLDTTTADGSRYSTNVG